MPDLSENLTPPVLTLLTRWLNEPPAQEAPPTILQELANALDAKAAGLWGPLDGPPNVVFLSPGSRSVNWKNHAVNLAELRQGQTTIVRGEADALDWLAMPLSGLGHCVSWILGIAKPTGHEWTQAEKSAAFLIGQTLFRILADSLAHRDWKDGHAKALVDRDMAQASQICSRLAHDFGNILTGVLGFSELLVTQFAAGTDSHTYIKEVHQSAKKGAFWVQMLQLFSRRIPPPQWQPAALRPVLDDEVQRISKACQGRIAIQALVPPDLPHILMDAESMRQLLAQVLNNAADSITTPTGVVMIRAQTVSLTESDTLKLVGAPRIGPNVEIQIQDNGSGISPDHKCKLFRELFFSTKPRHRGLGLAVTYGILRTYQGGIRLQPAEPRGTLATLYLPTVGPKPTAGDANNPDDSQQSATSHQGVRP